MSPPGSCLFGYRLCMSTSRKKLAEGKHYNVAISHVIRKLVRIIYQLLKDNKPYEEQKMIVN